MSNLHVTVLAVDNFGEQTIQVTKDIPSALRWFRDQVTESEWASFYSAMTPTERGSLNEDHHKIPAPEFMEAWVGSREKVEDEQGRDVYEYGNGTDYLVRVWSQDVL